MNTTETPSLVSYRVATASIFAASYLPSLGGLVYGLSQCACDACRHSWFQFVWMVQGVIIPLLAGNYLFHRPHFFVGNWGVVLPILVQIAWLAVWIWLANKGRFWLVLSTIVVLALSTWFAYGMYAAIRA